MPDLVSDLLRQVNDHERITRINAIARAWDAYFNRMEPTINRGDSDADDDNLPLPLAQVVVDAGRSYLMGDDLPFTVGNVTTGSPDAAQVYLDTVWKANKRPTMLQNIALNGSVGGHAWVKLIQRPDDPLPKIVNLDPMNVDVLCEEDDFTDVYTYVIQWVVERQDKGDFLNNRDPKRVIWSRRQLIDRQDNGTWLIVDQESRGDSPNWVETARETWNRDWPPIIGCQNLPSPNEYFGLSDLEPGIIDLIQDINFLISNGSRIIRFHGHPRVYFTGVADPGTLEWDPDEAMGLPAGASVGQLVPAADLSQILSLYNEVVNVFHEVTRVPRVALGEIDQAGPTPGVTLRILYQPLASKTADKQRLYGDLLDTLNQRILDLGQFGPDAEVDIPWQDPVPEDPLYQAQTAAAQETAGVSKATAVKGMGFDPDEEAAGRQMDQEEAGAAMMAAQTQLAGQAE